MKYIFLILFSFCWLPVCAGDKSPWGVSAHPTSEREWKNIRLLMKRANNAGIKWIREDFKFSYIHPSKDTFCFNRYDSLLNIASQHNIHILPILQAYDNEIKNKWPEATPIYKSPELWRQFVRKTVKRYHSHLKYWEIWNEQDGGFWKPFPDANQYVLLLKIAYEEIKKIDSSCQVIVGGLCSWNADYLQAMYNAGAKGYFDILAVHPYGFAPDANLKMERMKKEVWEVIQKNDTKNIPVWITEFGGSSFTGQLPTRYPDFMWKAIHFALAKINRPVSQPTIGIAVSPRTTRLEEVETTRNWLPGIKLKLIPFDQLLTLHPDSCPVLIGAEGLNIDEPLLGPLKDYVARGGLLIAANKVPFYTMHFLDRNGIWQKKDNGKEIYSFFRMDYEAFWTKQGIPAYTHQVKTGKEALKAGLPSVNNIYADRFLTPDNLKEKDRYYPLIRAYDKGKPVGDGMALYTYGDWKGGILISTISLETGYTEAEQANLLQRNYLVYLSQGVEKMFWYDMHCDGPFPGEREHNFGLLNEDWTLKPAYYAYQTLTASLGESPVFLQRIDVKKMHVWVLLFKRIEDGCTILAAWSTKGKEQIEITYRNGKKENLSVSNSSVKLMPLVDYTVIR